MKYIVFIWYYMEKGSITFHWYLSCEKKILDQHFCVYSTFAMWWKGFINLLINFICVLQLIVSFYFIFHSLKFLRNQNLLLNRTNLFLLFFLHCFKNWQFFSKFKLKNIFFYRNVHIVKKTVKLLTVYKFFFIFKYFSKWF